MIVDEEAYLEHFGVKGMRWGVRRDRDGVSRKTDREAQKDAKEFAAAKMFYGKGAGTRRKLIRESVAAKSKKDPDYAKAFKKHLDSQDMSKHAGKARSERKSIDRREKTKQRLGYLARSKTGEMGTQAAFMAVAAGGVAFMASSRGRALLNTGISRVRNVANSRAQRQGAQFISDYIRRNS